MKIAVMDIQGFYLKKEYYPKEIAIEISGKINHFLLKPKILFNDLSLSERKTIISTQNYHGLRYMSGYIEWNKINDILLDNLYDVDTVYIRGNQKHDFLWKKAWELDLKCTFIDISQYDQEHSGTSERYSNPPKIESTGKPQCLNHTIPARCALNNCHEISRWINSILP